MFLRFEFRRENCAIVSNFEQRYSISNRRVTISIQVQDRSLLSSLNNLLDKGEF